MDTRQGAEAAARQVGLNQNFLAVGAAHELLITRTESSGSYSGCHAGLSNVGDRSDSAICTGGCGEY